MVQPDSARGGTPWNVLYGTIWYHILLSGTIYYMVLYGTIYCMVLTLYGTIHYILLLWPSRGATFKNFGARPAGGLKGITEPNQT